MNLETLAIHGAAQKTEAQEHVYPIYQSSTFVFDNVDQGAARFAGTEDGYIYSRLNNPTVNVLAERLALLEEAKYGRVYGTGMAAITTVLAAVLNAGDHIIMDPVIYGCTNSLMNHVLSRFNIEYSFVDTTNITEVKNNLKKNTKVVFLETPANPTMKEVDIKAVADVVHEHNKDITVVVDNTFATPVYQKPLNEGADVVVHSCTKYINGHGDVVAGAAMFNNKKLVPKIDKVQIDFGTTPSPFDAWLITRGLRTLPIRMERHTKNAKQVVEFLEKNNKIESVYYPGYSGMIAFELNGGVEAGKKMLNSVKLCTLAVSLGNVDTLIQHPASMTHAVVPKETREQAGITDGLVRLSVGIENVQDIISDLEQALNKV